MKASNNAGLGLQEPELGPQLVFGFNPLGIDRYALDRANLHTLGLIEMAHTLGALVGVDAVEIGTHRNGFVGALGFAHITIDAFFGDQQSHLGARQVATPGGFCCLAG
jgi:hypothetical protein